MRRTEGARAESPLQKLQTLDEKEEREGARAESPLQKLERKKIGARAKGPLREPRTARERQESEVNCRQRMPSKTPL
jgi:hypothetical protein